MNDIKVNLGLVNAWEAITMGYESWHGQAKSNLEVRYKEVVASFKDIIDMLSGECLLKITPFDISKC